MKRIHSQIKDYPIIAQGVIWATLTVISYCSLTAVAYLAAALFEVI